MAAPSPDVVVIGAGLVGSMCALRLAECGLRVTVVEADFPGAGSTGAAMGHIVVMDDSDVQRDLCAWSRQRWEEILPELGSVAEYERTGTLWLAADAAELEIATRRAAGYVAAGVEATVLTADELADAEPHLRRGLAGALHVPGDGVCYPPAIARAIVDRAVSLGASTVRASVSAVASGTVTLDDGSIIAAGDIVVAAGVASRSLLPSLPIIPRKGHLVITERTAGVVRHQLIELGYMRAAHSMEASSISFNVQPRRNGQLLIGSSREFAGLDASINHALVAAMLRRAIEMIPRVAECRAWRTWTGFRPATPDSLPLIGPWTPLPGVWVAAGHEGLGITMAPGTAELVVAGITRTPPPLPAGPFDPCRTMPGTMAA